LDQKDNEFLEKRKDRQRDTSTLTPSTGAIEANDIVLP